MTWSGKAWRPTCFPTLSQGCTAPSGEVCLAAAPGCFAVTWVPVNRGGTAAPHEPRWAHWLPMSRGGTVGPHDPRWAHWLPMSRGGHVLRGFPEGSWPGTVQAVARGPKAGSSVPTPLAAAQTLWRQTPPLLLRVCFPWRRPPCPGVDGAASSSRLRAAGKDKPQPGPGAGTEPGTAVRGREGRQGRPPLSDGRAEAGAGPPPPQRRSRRGQDAPPGLGSRER